MTAKKRPYATKTGTRRNVWMNEDTRQSLIDIGMKAGAKEGRAASLGLRISAAYHERLVEALGNLKYGLESKLSGSPEFTLESMIEGVDKLLSEVEGIKK